MESADHNTDPQSKWQNHFQQKKKGIMEDRGKDEKSRKGGHSWSGRSLFNRSRLWERGNLTLGTPQLRGSIELREKVGPSRGGVRGLSTTKKGEAI